MLLGLETTETVIIRHMTLTLYQSRWVLFTWYFFKRLCNFSFILSSINMAERILNYRMIKLYFPSPVTNLLTSVMQCWVQRKMVGSSNSHHIQHLSLSSECTTESSLRSDVLSSCLCVFAFLLLCTASWQSFFFFLFLDVNILKESPSIWWQHFRNCLQPLAQWWRHRSKARKPDRVDWGTANFLQCRW